MIIIPDKCDSDDIKPPNSDKFYCLSSLAQNDIQSETLVSK